LHTLAPMCVARFIARAHAYTRAPGGRAQRAHAHAMRMSVCPNLYIHIYIYIYIMRASACLSNSQLWCGKAHACVRARARSCARAHISVSKIYPTPNFCICSLAHMHTARERSVFHYMKQRLSKSSWSESFPFIRANPPSRAHTQTRAKPAGPPPPPPRPPPPRGTPPTPPPRRRRRRRRRRGWGGTRMGRCRTWTTRRSESTCGATARPCRERCVRIRVCVCVGLCARAC
jgi:hypothetical protein